MPQTSVEELTSRLLAATDSKGHVQDIQVVSEVVGQLETMLITADDLKVTRLGKHINSVRRELADTHKSLAKRMKALVKSWQKLLQARPLNGIPPTPTTTRTLTPTPSAPRPLTSTPQTLTPRTSTPTPSTRPTSPQFPSSPSRREQLIASPVKHDSSVLTIKSSSPKLVKELFPERKTLANGAAEKVSDPTKNRLKLEKLLSKVKKPLTQTSTESVSQPSGRFSSKNFVPVEENGNSSNGTGTLLNPSPPSISVTDSESASSLRVCLPRNSIPRTPQTSRKTLKKAHKRLKHEVIESLVVSLPRIKLLKSYKMPAKVSTLGTTESAPEDLVVSVSIHHLKHCPSHRPHSHWQREVKAGFNHDRSTGHVPTGKKIESAPTAKQPLTVKQIERSPISKPTEHAPTVKPTEHVLTNKWTEHTPTVERTEHAQSISHTPSFQTPEPESMDIDSVCDGPASSSNHTTSAMDTLPSTQAEPTVARLPDAHMGWNVAKLPSVELNEYACLTGPVLGGEDTSVVILPYVYIDGVTDGFL